MNTFRNQVRVLFVLFAFASMAMAQQLTLSESGVLQAGESIKVEYSDPSRAGDTVTITISNGDIDPLYEEVSFDVTLDASGKATIEWTVDGEWDHAVFSGPGASPITRGIGSRDLVTA